MIILQDRGDFYFPESGGESFYSVFRKGKEAKDFGNNHAVVMYYHQNFNLSNKKVKSIVSVGHQWRPSVTETRIK